MNVKTSPVTYAQQGVYVDCIIEPENLRYNNPNIVSFPASVPPEDVAEAVRSVLECHPALFSHFEDRDGVAVQVYADRCKAEVGMSKVDDADLETAKKDFVRIFDIGRGPLYRAEVLASPSQTVLLMDFHHLVYDGFSINILMNGICSVLDGRKPSAEPHSYAEFAEAQQADTTDHKSYYAELLGDGITPTQMPSDLGGENGPRAECIQYVSAPDVMSRAKALGTAPSALFMAAAYYTLSRYANTRDLCLTTISNGRHNPLTEGIVGMFVLTLPLVSRIRDVSVLQFIHDTRRSFQETRQHEEYPFASMVNDYGIEQHVRFTYQYGTLGNTFNVRGVEVKAEAMCINSHPFPFTISIRNIEDRPAIVINYDTARYSADLAGRFAESMDAIVSRFLENPQARLLSVSMMSGTQKEEVEALRQTCIDHSAVRFPLFHNSIEYWAEQTPDATALIACNETLTYREFNAKANILAHALIERGVRPGDRVCLLLPRKSWHLLAMFGVMKTGAAYIPCDPEYPSERIKLITEDSHARFVITTAGKMDDYGDHAIDIEELLATAATDANVANPGIEQGSESLAYLIYTSGSTGRPKGVMLRHIGICNYLTDHEENRHFHALVSRCRTMLCITTVSFDLSLKEIGAALFNGMTLVFADENQVNDPQALANLMHETGVDGFSGTPSRLKMFLDLPDFRKALSECKFIVLGGEKYPPTLLPQIKELAPHACLYNTYGPTEISVSCNGKDLTRSDRITIGRPLLNVKEYVVDSDLNELPVGVTGELLIGGLGVAAGYNDLPDKTAEAFIDYKGERCYKSGDYAYWNADGDVVILGRKDHQIKLNGLRIELGEVETVLNRQPQVKESVVMIRNVEGHEHLVAYYVPVAGHESEAGIVDALKEQMGRSLTHYMVPTIFVEMKKMPVSPNGKTDLKALPTPSVELGEEEKTKAETADEKALCDIVAEVVGNSNFGTTTNLISIGLTSLLAIRLSVFVNGRMKATLPVREILRHPTVRELAARLQREDGAVTEVTEKHSASCGKAAAAPLNALEFELKAIIASVINSEDFAITDVLGYVGLNPISSIRLAALIHKKFGVQIDTKSLVNSESLQSIENKILLKWMNSDATPSGESAAKNGTTSPEAEETVSEAPLTFPQQGVFMDCQMNPDTTMYNMPTMLEFPSGTSPEALGSAVKTVVGTHPALMCNFFQTAEGAVMRYVPGDRFDVPVRTISAEEIEEARQAFVRPFDLEHDTLVRAEICSVPDGPVFLMMDIHHLVGDGASFDLCIKQILALMEGRKIDSEGLSYLHFAKEQATKTAPEENKAFFDEMFSTYESAANVPSDKSSNVEGLPQHIAAPIPEALLNITLPQGVTQAHFWFAAFNYALARFANTKDVYSTFISSGRQDIRIADTAGMFVNTLPCAVHVKDQTVSEFIQETSEAFYGSLDHENYSFARIASDYDFKGYASFAYQMGVMSTYTIGGKKVVRSSASLSKAKIPFCIFIQNVGGVPSVDVEYDDSKYSRELALHFAESMVAVAEHFAAAMDAPVKNVSIMSERQRKEVEAMHVYRKEDVVIQTIHEGFEQWAVKTPDATAIITSDRCLTYGEYNAEANRLARALLAHGAVYGDRIVLLLPRRSYYLTSLFAVMKIGASFIPMDPEYPADRIAYILDDSEGRFVLTTDDKLADYPGRALSISSLMEEAKSLPDGNLDIKVDPHDLAYVIYTSGSTGRPKGVMLEHFGASNFLRWWTLSCPGLDMTKYIAISQATVSFDYSIAEFGMQLFNGATVAFANEEQTKNPMEMIKFCKRFGINAMNGTPSRVAINMEIEDYKEMMRTQMKLLTVGGEKLPWTMVEDIKAMGITLVNAYGPTETSMGSSAAIMNDAKQVHVGKPFPNYSYMILDSDRNELPVGVMGELCIGGIGLARGYNNMPERTAETFIMWNGERIYRTGDYAMWTDEGNVIIMGRTDNQVKLNGLRIELGEVETVMKQQPGIRQCVAAIKKVGNIDKLIGYYTTLEPVDETKFEEQMRAMMGEHVTPYMVPGIFMHLDEMPLTPVGKTDIKRLPLPEVQAGEYVAPANDVEKVLCEAFATTLKLDKVGATNNFFELGGTSLVAMRLIGLAVKAGLNMVYKNIFDNPTPRLLTQMLHPELYTDAAASAEKEEKELYPFQKDVENYDYSCLEEVLAGNNLKTFLNGRMYGHIGNVFLTGATGFLGIHVLHNLICRDDVPHIYCMVRGSRSINAGSRLRTLLYYYFGNSYDELFGSRIVVVEGDVTDAKVFCTFDQPLDLVINCAANVKHFSAGTDIEDINIGGCRNCIELCLRTGARFVQTSTGSITGSTVSDQPVAPHYLTERELYFGQTQFSKYSCSKFLAERAVLDAVHFRGLKGKIVRLGNLCARSTDGEFQINFRSNTFMGKLKAYQVLGCVPYSMDCGFSEFSPINEVADAIIRLSLTPDECTVFHPVNIHWPPLGDVIECMNHLGLNIERVEDDVYAERLSNAMADEQTSTIMQSLVGYRNVVDGKVVTGNTCDVTHYTAQVLLRLGFRWSYTSWDYMESYLRGLMGLGVFDKDYQR